MSERLFVGVLGRRNSGKSTTWNKLFGKSVRTGKQTRHLRVCSGGSVETFLVSGSFEERKLYAGDVLKNQNCRIVLCSLQYAAEVRKTLDFIWAERFQVHIQWLNPGYSDSMDYFDCLGLIPELLSNGASVTMRNGKTNPSSRVEEIREHIHGWANSRGLVF